MQIFSIVVTYNGIKWYDKCFGSLKNSDVPVQIVVIDNASSDGSVSYIREKFPDIILIESKENLGFAKANNIGMRYALDHGADYVFLLNQDAWINEKNTISELVRISQQNSQFYILSPLQLYAGSGRIQTEVLYHFACEASSDNDYLSDLYRDRILDLYEISFSCAACWLLPIKTLQKIGGFDPIFYHYGEDDNYVQRVRFHGGNIAICPKISYSHDIENRLNDYRKENQDWKKYMLIKICDINLDINIKSLLKGKKYVLLLMLLRFQRKKFRKLFPEYKYIKVMKEKLEESRLVNKEGGSCWL